jgi:hypothetical protein
MVLAVAVGTQVMFGKLLYSSFMIMCGSTFYIDMNKKGLFYRGLFKTTTVTYAQVQALTDIDLVISEKWGTTRLDMMHIKLNNNKTLRINCSTLLLNESLDLKFRLAENTGITII